WFTGTGPGDTSRLPRSSRLRRSCAPACPEVAALDTQSSGRRGGEAEIAATSGLSRGGGARRSRDGRAGGQRYESQKGVLAGRGVHEVGSDRVLRCGGAVAPAVPQGPAARAHTLSGWDQGQVVLPEGRARVDSVVGQDRADPFARRGPRHRLLHRGRPREASLCGESRY